MSLHDFPDRAIRDALRHPANLRDLLAEVVPDLAGRFDFDRAEVVERSFLLDDWRGRESDLLFVIPFRAADAEQPVLVCVLIEHQTEPDPRMPLRMLLYAVLYWEREWKAWEDGHPEGESLGLTPILPVVFHTGHTRWGSNRTLAELIRGPEAFRAFVPQWHVLFWDLAERDTAGLVETAGEFMRAMAVVRAEREDTATFQQVYAEVLRRLEPLHDRDRMRWHDLVKFILSWGWFRRPRGDWDVLLAAAAESQGNVARQQEVKGMSETVGRTFAEEVFAEGEARGVLQASRDALRELLEERFGTLPASLVQRIETTNDLVRLKAAHRQAARINTIDELQL